MRNSKDFVDSGGAFQHFFYTIHPQSRHTPFLGHRFDSRRMGTLKNKAPDGIVHCQNFVDPGPPLVTRLKAGGAARTTVEGGGRRLHISQTDLSQQGPVRFEGLLAAGADHPHKSLGDDRYYRRYHQKWLDPHIHQTGDRTRGVVRVEGAENQMSCEAA